MADLLREVRRRFDFCLLDAPAGLGRGFQLATCAADRCVVVTTADASSLRDAQHTVMELDRFPGRRPAPGGESSAQKAAAPAPRHH